MDLKEFYLDLDISSPVLLRAVEYLKNYPNTEEGGILLGRRIWDETRTKLKVQVRAFIPVKSSPNSWNLSKAEFKEFEIPPEEIGYLPNPSEVIALRKKIFPYNEKSSLMEVGFIHNHMQYAANPSFWDRKHTVSEFGYLMPIYSNKNKHLKVWFISQNTEKQWKSKELNLLAPVELAATL